EAFAHSPLLDVCDRWPVDAAPSGIAEPVRSTVPTLAAVGAFAPYAPEEPVRAGLTGLTNLTFLVDPAHGHNVVPLVQCIDDIRNAWLADPNEPPTMDCLDAVPVRWELP